MKQIKVESIYHLHNNVVDAFPRKARFLNCFIISLYGALFFSLLCPWFNSSYDYLRLQINIIFISCFLVLFILLYKRQSIYNMYCKLLKRKILLFEFGFFCTVSIIYGILTTIIPITLNMIHHGSLTQVLEDQSLKRFIIFSGGAIVCVGVIAGFDTYPVNKFGSLKSIERLIEITKGLLKTSNRSLITITSVIVIGNILSNRKIELHELYVTLYGIIGVAFGVSGVLGSRLAELLHMLSLREANESLKSKSKLGNTSSELESLY